MLLRWILAGLSPVLVVLSLFFREPLLHAACWITGMVALYTALYAKRGWGAYALFYLLAVAGVALFLRGEGWLALFAGWELVSVAAWGLIVQTRSGARAQTVALLTFVVNRLGDVFWLAAAFSQGRFPEGFVLAGFVKGGLFPFTFWLIQAMYAPAPVSALLHSALLVTLGVYWIVRYPQWASGLDWAVWREVGGISGIIAGIGALGSRHPKGILAWTTAAHLAAALRLASQPAQMQSYLLEHAYLKAALFLLIGITQKNKSVGLLTLGLIVGASVLLVGSAPQTDAFLLATEGAVALSLGRMIGRLRFTWQIEGKETWGLLFPVVFLVGKALGESPSMALLALSLGGIVGVLLARYKLYWRLDKGVLQLFAGILRLWEGIALFMRSLEAQLSHSLDRLGMAFVALGVKAEKSESWASEWGWRKAAGVFRQWAAVFAGEGMPMPYTQALRWGLLITLGGGLLWRLLR